MRSIYRTAQVLSSCATCPRAGKRPAKLASFKFPCGKSEALLALVADCRGMTAYPETDPLPDCEVFWAATDIRRRTAKRLYESFSERPSVGKTTKLFQPACRLTSRSVPSGKKRRRETVRLHQTLSRRFVR